MGFELLIFSPTTPFDVLGSVRSRNSSWNIFHHDCFYQCIICHDKVCLCFLFCQLCCLSVIFAFVSGLWGLVPGVFMDYGDSNVRQCGNKNWNNVHRRARLPHAMCIDTRALMLVHCQGLCRHFSPCPLVFPCHVTCYMSPDPTLSS